MTPAADEFGTLMLLVVVFGLILAVLWIALPFAVFGAKGLLKTMIHEQRRTNELLTALGQQQADEIERQQAARR